MSRPPLRSKAKQTGPKRQQGKFSNHRSTTGLERAAVVTLTSSVLVWIPGGLDRFVFPKLLLAVIGVLLAALCKPSVHLPRSVSITLFSGAVLLSAAAMASGDPFTQIIGRWPRYEGVIALPVYLGAAWSGARLLGSAGSPDLRDFFLKCTAAVSIALTLFSVLEASGLPSLGGATARPGALLGNATDQGILGMIIAGILGASALGTSAARERAEQD